MPNYLLFLPLTSPLVRLILWQFDTIVVCYDDSDDVTRGVMNWVFMSLCGWSIPDLCRIAENIKDCDDIAGIEDASKVERADVPVIYPDVVVGKVNPHPPEFIRLN